MELKQHKKPDKNKKVVEFMELDGLGFVEIWDGVWSSELPSDEEDEIVVCSPKASVCSFLSYFILFYFILFYFILFYFILFLLHIL